MSRYGKLPIPLAKGVEVKKSGQTVHVKGPKGELNLTLKDGLDLKMGDNEITITFDESSQLHKAMHGLYRSLVNNMVIGVSQGYEIKLNLVGVGYRAALSGHHLDLALGYSHPVRLEIPKSIKVGVDKQVTISIQGIDKREVGQFAASVRQVRPPEPYKGKGVRYEGEVVRKKDGKAAKGKAA